MDVRWRIRLLGQLCAESTERTITRFRTQKTAALLAYLAYHRDASHPRDVVIEILWPEDEMESARKKLRNALSSLRSQLEPPGVPPGAVLVTNRASVSLNPLSVTTDAAAFEAALQRAREAEGEIERRHHLTEAVEIYRGELLPGFYEEWIFPERERLAEGYYQALCQLIGQLERGGEWDRAIDHARRAVGADPLREEAHRELIRLLAAAGRPAAAQQQFREVEKLLWEELGEKPSMATRELARSIQAEDVTSLASLPPKALARPRLSTPVRFSRSEKLPTGTVGFLLAEILAASPSSPEEAARVTAAERGMRAICEDVSRHGGHVVREAASSIVAVFERTSQAAACAVALKPAVDDGTLVRVALHTGEVEGMEARYDGAALEHTERVMLAAHHGQILCTEAAAAVLRGVREPGKTGFRLDDLGLYRLRDVTTGAGIPERLFQVVYPAMPHRQFPPPQAEPLFSGHLPLQFTRFFGREEEITRLVEWLLADPDLAPAADLHSRPRSATDDRRPMTDEPSPNAPRSTLNTPPPTPNTQYPTPSVPRSRLVTLTGPGGTGKTRLALEVASRLIEPFRGAIWFVPLADVTQARDLPDAVLDALRVTRTASVEPLEELVAALPRQPALLVLDNFEQLVAEGAEIVAALLQRAPGLTCLVTSRQRLNLAGEQEFPVAPLETPGRVETPERLALNESVRLFVNRAQAVRPDFQVTAQSAGVLAELCRRLEGIPLAIELAAARAGVLTPVQMLAQLDRRFDFLVSRQHDTAFRHRTLRAAIDWSFDQLPPELQQLFARLSVFCGGFTLEAAEAVCTGVQALGCWGAEGGPDDRRQTTDHPGRPVPQHLNTPTPQPLSPEVLDGLEQLRECSLVNSAVADAGARYSLLETLREYAWERLIDRHESETVACRHMEFFLSLAEADGEALARFTEPAAFHRLSSEIDNVRAVLGWALEHAPETGLRLLRTLWPLWRVRGHWDEAGAWLQSYLAPEHGVPPRARAEMLDLAADTARNQRRLEQAEALTRESLTIHRQGRDTRGAAGALRRLAAIACEQGDVESACSFMDESLTAGAPRDDPKEKAASFRRLGSVAFQQGSYRRAHTLFERALAIYRKLGDKSSCQGPLIHLGHVALHQEDYARAGRYYEESVALRKALGNQLNVAHALYHVGNVALYQGRYARARAAYEEAQAIVRQFGALGATASMGLALARLEFYQGRYAMSRSLYEESLTTWRRLEARETVAQILAAVARVTRAQGDIAGARALCEESLEIYRELDDSAATACLLDELGHTARDGGGYSRARAYYEESLELRTKVGDPCGIATSHLHLGEAALAAGDLGRARAFFGECLVRYRAAREPAGVPPGPCGPERTSRSKEVSSRVRALHHDGLVTRRGLGGRRGIADALNGLGRVALAAGDAVRARRLLSESLQIRRDLGEKRETALALMELARALLTAGHVAEAHAHYSESLHLLRELEVPSLLARCLDGLAEWALSAWQPERAAQLLGAGEALREAIGVALPHSETRLRKPIVAAVRTALGDKPFTRAWAHGRAMPLDQAVASALQADQPPHHPE